MKKNIQDYLHLYIGQSMQYIGAGKPFRGTSKSEKLTHENFELLSFSNDRKLLLRPLSDMTDGECLEYNTIMATCFSIDSFKNQCLNEAAKTKYLLSLGFDIFNLHEENLCFYKSDLK